MKVLLVDDEPLARSRMRRLLQAHADVDLVGEAEDGQQALELCRSLQPDLLLLDIEMPTLSGLDVAKALSDVVVPPALVFVTAHPQHALNAWQLAAAGYLVKPVSAEALADLLGRLGKPNRVQLEAKKEPVISYQLAGVSRQVALSAILYLQAEDKYVRLVFQGGEALIEQSLRQLELDYPQLLRIHRKVLINSQHFVALHQHGSGYWLELNGCAERLDVSRREASKIRLLLQQQKL
ncbi:LytTR family DNA-binding domain-containing protein [Alkalimonas collagenimarina]|uniref:LytTR family DNA-binding domain-containing protein n=1 Tax=Alkalimonas collagenimarina TaxID=400390 RepID=A0ABT9H0X5_9GAMM|nr:LytTR family DNA-binding domain-containing protein [Alkalimonas collagenimarina]MDP4536858.1 LytTR family DNA-binding domain-containing protein [Alkalimonas collagenimarina]